MPFKKGQSGNPGGRPKAAVDIQMLARAHTKEAINALVSALTDAKTRVSAAVALLDRAYGRPLQTVAAHVELKRASELTDDELADIAAISGKRITETQDDSPQLH